MIQPAESLKYNPSLVLVDDAGTPAKRYFALKKARLDFAGDQRSECLPQFIQC